MFLVVGSDRVASEENAARIVATILGAPVEPVDGPTAPPGSPDFKIQLPEGPVPLEVTRSTDGDLRSYYAQVGGQDWEDPQLHSSWSISVGYGAAPQVTKLRTRLSPVLIELEAAGITAFDMDEPDKQGRRPDPLAPWAPLASFGVRRGRAVELGGPSRVFMGSSGAFSTGPEVLDSLVVAELANNSSKVGDRGHLFIWVDSLNHHAYAGMHLDYPPDGRPDIPPAVGVWVARNSTGDNRWQPDRLWRLPPHCDWKRVAQLGDEEP